MKKILLVIDNLGSGGAQNQLTLLAVGLKNIGHYVKVFVYHKQEFFKARLINNDIEIVYCEKKSKLGLNIIKQIANQISSEKFDTMISFLDTPNMLSIIASKITTKKVKVIISYRSKTDFKKLPWYSLHFKKWINSQAHFIVTNSYHEKLNWMYLQPNIAYKIKTIYNAIDKNKFNSNKIIYRNNKYLIVGSVSKDKNGLFVLKALLLLKKWGLNISIDWVGQHVTEIKERADYLNLMKRFINEFQLKEDFTWKDPTNELEIYYQSYKALILASETEGVPNVVCEALACGMPVIISDVLDHPKIVKHKENGFLFTTNNAMSLVAAILEMEKLSIDEYKKMSLHAANSAHILFDFEKFIEGYNKLINEVI